MKHRESLSELKAKAERLEELYARMKVKLKPEYSITQLIARAKAASDGYDQQDAEVGNYQDFFQSMHLRRVVNAGLQVEGHKRAKSYLKWLTLGTLDFFVRADPQVGQGSKAKDYLWELELWSLLKERGEPKGLTADLDEPDVTAKVCGYTYNFACKKIYELKNINTPLKKAVKQVRKHDGIGIAALNIEEMTDPGRIHQSRDPLESYAVLSEMTDAFREAHRQAIITRLEADSLQGALSTTALSPIALSIDLGSTTYMIQNSYLDRILMAMSPLLLQP